MTPMQDRIAAEARSKGFSEVVAGSHAGSVSIGTGIRNGNGEQLFASVTVTDREGVSSIPRKVAQVRDEVDRRVAA